MPQPVHAVDHPAVLRQHPRRPRIHVPDGLALERCTADPIAHPADVALDFGAGGAHTRVICHALRRTAVEILRSNTDAYNPVRERTTQVTCCGQEGIEFVLVHATAGAGPQADEDLGVGVDGGAEGLNGRRGGAALD